MPLSHLIALMIHARRRKTVRISQNLCAPSRARTNHQNHTRHQASACGSPYGLLGSRPHDQNFKTMVADASRIHTSCFNAPGPSRKRSHKEPPQRRWPASQETSRYASSSSSQCQTIPNVKDSRRYTRQTHPRQGNLLLFNGHFYKQPQSPQAAAPSKWWSQTGSNRRPPECKSGALPAELWPRAVISDQ
jgi:hypothetical protein